jgi:hypothetical protein
MRYLVHVVERTRATYEVEARSVAEAESKAGDQNYEGRDEWDTDIVTITGVEKKAAA